MRKYRTARGAHAAARVYGRAAAVAAAKRGIPGHIRVILGKSYRAATEAAEQLHLAEVAGAGHPDKEEGDRRASCLPRPMWTE